MMNYSKSTRSSIDVDRQPKQSTLNIVVVGQALARRLLRKSFLRTNGLSTKLVGVFDSLAESTKAGLVSTMPRVDLLLMHTASLQIGALQELRTAQEAWQANSTAVIYGYSNTAARAEFINSDTPLLQDPIDDESLSKWLAELETTSTNEVKRHTISKLDNLSMAELTESEVTVPKFTDDTLIAFAGLSSTIACECPSHLAELLMRISHFETYSSDCNNRNTADAQLHTYLKKISGVARMLFETALEHVAKAEGLPLLSDNSANISLWVEHFLSAEFAKAREIRETFVDFPIYFTRELDTAKIWLRSKALETSGRSGLVASSKSKRLLVYGVDAVADANRSFSWANWYLNNPPDLTSSGSLEVAATEYKCQGLELDFVGVCWSWDLVLQRNSWLPRTLSSASARWSSTKSKSQFQTNAYRVLLTRSRKGMIVWIPRGDDLDPSRDVKEMDIVASCFEAAGVSQI
jgi:hypothetical protein